MSKISMKDDFSDFFFCFFLFVKIDRDVSWSVGDFGDEWAYGGRTELVGM